MNADSMLFLDKPLWMWGVFVAVVAGLLAFDLGLLHRRAREITVRESLWLSGFYILAALTFAGWVWVQLGAGASQEFLTGFLVEKSLALDNVFLISLVFTSLAIPLRYQHRVLFWGILGVIVMRGIMIGLGAALVSRFSWILTLFALFLIVTGVKMLFLRERTTQLDDNPLLRWLRRRVRITDGLQGERFLARLPHPATGQLVWYATPLLVALVLIECVDLVFAVDSVPAIFTITTDPYIVYTSNIFAILGLRALYFALAAVIHRFEYLKPALALVLIFIGSKTVIADLMGWQKFPADVSLAVTGGLIAGGVILSLICSRTAERE